jgi:hypothetical protein
MADFIVVRNGRQRFAWGRKNLASAGQIRAQYIDALKQADGGNITPLLKFAR